MREIVEVHYKIIDFSGDKYKLYILTEDGPKRRKWMKRKAPNWVPVEDEILIDELNLAYNNMIYDNEQNENQ